VFDQAEQQFDVVVHTAGIQLLAPLAELKLDDLDRMHRTNIRGTFVAGQVLYANGGASKPSPPITTTTHGEDRA
jgi:NADP-dependent 3-hydroxy acid dehydrogenase YdfG